MLFPLAECNLSRLLSEPEPDWSASNINWLFSQLFALTDALHRIHIFDPAGPSTASSPNLRVPVPRRHGGFHHDLKPANILIFCSKGDQGRVLKISDFGAAKLNFAISSKSPLGYRDQGEFGDPVYAAPDHLHEGGAGRRADIWSLGCCFLEVLLWRFGYGGSQLQDFASDRLKVPKGNNTNCASFWYTNTATRKPALKPEVVKRLETLETVCDSRGGAFPLMVKQIRLMLMPKSTDRPDAAQVRSAFEALMIEAKANLREDPDCYRFVRPQVRTNVVMATKPLTLVREPSSNPDSSDDQNVGSPQAGPVTASESPPSHTSAAMTPRQNRSLTIETHENATILLGTHLSSQTDESPPQETRPRSPSITVTQVDIPDTQMQPSSPQSENQSENEFVPGPRARAIIGGILPPPTRNEIPTLRRRGSGSSHSNTM
jgi:serine/threonine protein kinase